MSTAWFYDPFYDFDRFFGEAFSPVFSRPQMRGISSEWRQEHGGVVRDLRPRMDLHEDEENNVVIAFVELPGLKEEDVRISVHNSRLVISAASEGSDGWEEKNEHSVLCGRRSGKILRSLQLPQYIKKEEVKARMDNGVLVVTFPRTSRKSSHIDFL